MTAFYGMYNLVHLSSYLANLVLFSEQVDPEHLCELCPEPEHPVAPNLFSPAPPPRPGCGPVHSALRIRGAPAGWQVTVRNAVWLLRIFLFWWLRLRLLLKIEMHNWDIAAFDKKVKQNRFKNCNA